MRCAAAGLCSAAAAGGLEPGPPAEPWPPHSAGPSTGGPIQQNMEDRNRSSVYKHFTMLIRLAVLTYLNNSTNTQIQHTTLHFKVRSDCVSSFSERDILLYGEIGAKFLSCRKATDSG